MVILSLNIIKLRKADKVKKYRLWGLFIFVAIPLPGTGAWTGTLAASFLNMGFKEDIESILEEIKQEHQTLMFSATMPKEILEIAKYYQNKPVHIEIKEKQKTVHTIDQLYFEVHKARKVDVLQVLMKVYPAKLTMIFCNTKKSVDEVSEELSKTNLPVVAIHGDMKQSVRSRVMEQFKSQQATVLVATDVAARGLDIDNVDKNILDKQIKNFIILYLHTYYSHN